jgi:hypothetical protein
MDRNTQALKTLAVTLAALTYCGAVLYGDIMFISVMHVAFPSGIMGALATAGAIMTAASAITLPLALHYWFAPGTQFVWGVIFWLVDIAALSLNAMLAYAVATGAGDSYLMQWQQLSPATPLLAVIGWGIAFLLDPSHKLRHAQAELEADLVDIHAAQLRQAAKGEDVSATITTGAKQAAADTAAKLTGRRVAATGQQHKPPQPATLNYNSEQDEEPEIAASSNGHGPAPKGNRRPTRRD